MTGAIERFVSALISVNRIAARDMFREFSSGNDPYRLIDKLVAPALEVIGDRWTRGTVALSEVYMSARIVEDMINEILPLDDPGRVGQPKMAIAVLEDYHFLGKHIICSVLRANGYQLLDYNRVTVAGAYEQILADGIEILLISTLMLPSALKVKDLKEKMEQEDLSTRLIVGGAPFRLDELLWREVNADATARDAAGLLMLLKQMMDEPS